MSRPTVRGAALALLLVLLPLFLRLWPIAHGLPRNYVPDTHSVRAALGMAKDRNLIPPVNQYSSYPYLLPYLLLPVYGAQYAAGRASGAWSSSEEFARHALEHPEDVALPARIVVALFGALTAWVVYRGARAAGLARGAWVAAYLVATGLLHVQLSLHERPWILVVCFGALSLWAAARFAGEARPRFLFASAAAAGLAFASHQAGLAFLLACGLAWLLGSDSSGWRTRLSRGAAAVLIFLAVGVLVGHPYYLRYGFVPEEAVVGGAQAAEHLSIGGQAVRFGISLSSLRHLSKAMAGYDPVLLLLGVCGLWPALRRGGTRFAAVFTLLYAAFFMTNPSDHVRYLLPLTVLLAWPAGLAAERLLASKFGAATLAALLLVPLLQALRLGHLLRQEDTRAEGERVLEQLAERAPAPFFVAIDHYGPLVDLSRKSLEDLASIRGELRTREVHRLELRRAGIQPDGKPGLDAIAVEELFEVDPRSDEYGVRSTLRARAPDPRSMLEALGVTHFLMVNRRPARATEPFLWRLAETWPLLASIDPSTGGEVASEAFLPTEMDFPLTGLWGVSRPGPWLGLYVCLP